MRTLLSVFFGERTGILSSKRVVVLYIAIVCSTCLFAVWTYLSIKNSTMIEIPGSVTSLFKFVITTLVAGGVLGTVADKSLKYNKEEKK